MWAVFSQWPVTASDTVFVLSYSTDIGCFQWSGPSNIKAMSFTYNIYYIRVVVCLMCVEYLHHHSAIGNTTYVRQTTDYGDHGFMVFLYLRNTPEKNAEVGNIQCPTTLWFMGIYFKPIKPDFILTHWCWLFVCCLFTILPYAVQSLELLCCPEPWFSGYFIVDRCLFQVTVN